MDKLFYPSPPVRCIITGPSECGKAYFLTNLILDIINEFEKPKFNYSPIVHQEILLKLFKCFSNSIPIDVILNILNEDIFLLMDEIVKD